MVGRIMALLTMVLRIIAHLMLVHPQDLGVCTQKVPMVAASTVTKSIRSIGAGAEAVTALHHRVVTPIECETVP